MRQVGYFMPRTGKNPCFRHFVAFPTANAHCLRVSVDLSVKVNGICDPCPVRISHNGRHRVRLHVRGGDERDVIRSGGRFGGLFEGTSCTTCAYRANAAVVHEAPWETYACRCVSCWNSNVSGIAVGVQQWMKSLPCTVVHVWRWTTRALCRFAGVVHVSEPVSPRAVHVGMLHASRLRLIVISHRAS